MPSRSDSALARDIADAAHFPEPIRADVADILVQLWRTLVDEDATLVEVNPLVQTPDGRVLALDGKVTSMRTRPFVIPITKRSSTSRGRTPSSCARGS